MLGNRCFFKLATVIPAACMMGVLGWVSPSKLKMWRRAAVGEVARKRADSSESLVDSVVTCCSCCSGCSGCSGSSGCSGCASVCCFLDGPSARFGGSAWAT